MTIVGEAIILVGAFVGLLAGIGLLKFSTPFARFHSAGKASPVAFLIAALGASIILGWAGAAYMLIASAAMVLTLPVGVHLLFRAAHRAGASRRLAVDHLRDAQATE